MSLRVSLVGGVVSFTAVILLSLLSLDMEGAQGFFMQELSVPQVEVAPVGDDSTENPCTKEIHR